MPSTSAKPRAASPTGARLNRDAWIAAAERMLAAEGVDAVNVEKLARKLGVTKGSFYWHFKSRDALLQDIIDQWRRRETAVLIDAIQRGVEPRTQLRELLELPFTINVADSPMRLTLAVRLWSQKDSRVRAAVTEIDNLRVRTFAKMFEDCGFPAAEARARSTLLYSYMRVAVTMVDPADADLRAMCEALLLDEPPPS